MLDKYDNVVLFPEKLAKANELLQKAGPPKFPESPKYLLPPCPDTLGGQPVFADSRVPAETLFDHLEAGVPLDEFLDDLPTVSR